MLNPWWEIDGHKVPRREPSPREPRTGMRDKLRTGCTGMSPQEPSPHERGQAALECPARMRGKLGTGGDKLGAGSA